MQHDITINQVTYHINRVYSREQSVSSIIQNRLLRYLAEPALLTKTAEICYNEHDETAWQKDAK